MPTPLPGGAQRGRARYHPAAVGRVVRLDLAKATEVRLPPPAGLGSLTGTVVARAQGKEVARLTRFLAVEGVPQAGEDREETGEARRLPFDDHRRRVSG